MDGRGSMVREEDGWWLYGAEPGVLAEDGENPHEAHLKFAASFKVLLFDIAANAPTFERFQEEVVQMFSQVNEPEAVRWNEALNAARSGRLPLEDPYLQSLPKKPPAPFGIIVMPLKEANASPELNRPTELAKAA